MNTSMKKPKMIAGIMLGVVVTVGVTLFLLEPWMKSWVAAFHQQAITRELANWERETSPITNHEEAVHAIEVMRYVERYYVPAKGYRSNKETEAALATQRQKTLEAIARTLEMYTGERWGTNISQWEQWRDQNTATRP